MPIIHFPPPIISDISRFFINKLKTSSVITDATRKSSTDDKLSKPGSLDIDTKSKVKDTKVQPEKKGDISKLSDIDKKAPQTNKEEKVNLLDAEKPSNNANNEFLLVNEKEKSNSAKEKNATRSADETAKDSSLHNDKDRESSSKEETAKSCQFTNKPTDVEVLNNDLTQGKLYKP